MNDFRGAVSYRKVNGNFAVVHGMEWCEGWICLLPDNAVRQVKTEAQGGAFPWDFR